MKFTQHQLTRVIVSLIGFMLVFALLIYFGMTRSPEDERQIETTELLILDDETFQAQISYVIYGLDERGERMEIKRLRCSDDGKTHLKLSIPEDVVAIMVERKRSGVIKRSSSPVKDHVEIDFTLKYD